MAAMRSRRCSPGSTWLTLTYPQATATRSAARTSALEPGGRGEASDAVTPVGTDGLADVESDRAESAADLLAEIAIALADAGDDGTKRLDG
jgi:hypothetical protein